MAEAVRDTEFCNGEENGQVCGYTTARRTVRREYLEDYLSLAGCAAVMTYFEEPYSTDDPVVTRALGGQRAIAADLPARKLTLMQGPWVYHPRCATEVSANLAARAATSAPDLIEQDRPPAADPDRDNDVQAVYSWLINHSAKQDKLYLVAPETFQSDYPNERCLEIPPNEVANGLVSVPRAVRQEKLKNESNAREMN
jgi:hypothetical protein